MISHRNVIANTLQIKTFEQSYRDQKAKEEGRSHHSMVTLGLLPQSHIYSLVVINHAGPYRGDQVITLPKFDMGSYLSAIQNFKIGGLFLVCCVVAVSWAVVSFEGKRARKLVVRRRHFLESCSRVVRRIASRPDKMYIEKLCELE